MLRIYLTNLGRYNEGIFVGQWVTLPIDNEELEAIKQRIGINQYYEEMFITDYESDIDGVSVGEYDNIEELNELAEALENLDDIELDVITALLAEGYGINEAIEKKDDCYIWFDCDDMEDVAMQYCDTCGMLEAMPEHLRNYFDFAAFGRDMSFEGHFVFVASGNCIEIN